MVLSLLSGLAKINVCIKSICAIWILKGSASVCGFTKMVVKKKLSSISILRRIRRRWKVVLGIIAMWTRGWWFTKPLNNHRVEGCFWSLWKGFHQSLVSRREESLMVLAFQRHLRVSVKQWVRSFLWRRKKCLTGLNIRPLLKQRLHPLNLPSTRRIVEKKRPTQHRKRVPTQWMQRMHPKQRP